MKRTTLVLLLALAGCASTPQSLDVVLTRPHPSDEAPPRPHSNNPMQMFFGTDGSAIRLPADRATRIRREGDVIVLE